MLDDEPPTERLFTEERKSTQPKFYSARDESTKPIEGTNNTDRSELIYSLKEWARWFSQKWILKTQYSHLRQSLENDYVTSLVQSRIRGKVTPLRSTDECAQIDESHDEVESSRNDTPVFERERDVWTE